MLYPPSIKKRCQTMLYNIEHCCLAVIWTEERQGGDICSIGKIPATSQNSGRYVGTFLAQSRKSTDAELTAITILTIGNTFLVYQYKSFES